MPLCQQFQAAFSKKFSKRPPNPNNRIRIIDFSSDPKDAWQNHRGDAVLEYNLLLFLHGPSRNRQHTIETGVDTKYNCRLSKTKGERADTPNAKKNLYHYFTPSIKML